METVYSSETLVSNCKSIRRHKLEDSHWQTEAYLKRRNVQVPGNLLQASFTVGYKVVTMSKETAGLCR
jgi:hypothetical protein